MPSELPGELAALGFEEARVVRLEPGDVIVLVTSRRLSMEDVEIMRERLGGLFADHRIAILEDGLSLEVLRKGDGDGRCATRMPGPFVPKGGEAR